MERNVYLENLDVILEGQRLQKEGKIPRVIYLDELEKEIKRNKSPWRRLIRWLFKKS